MNLIMLVNRSIVLFMASILLQDVIDFLFRDEAEMEYLKIAQDLEMYGVSYFEITVSLLQGFVIEVVY